ncbi:MAG: methylmalonyl-CoA mutase family protein [candidate division WOR-3 bacterium]
MRRTLDDLKAACAGRDNVMYPILEAVRAYATLGEICGAMKEVFGTYAEPPMF